MVPSVPSVVSAFFPTRVGTATHGCPLAAKCAAARASKLPELFALYVLLTPVFATLLFAQGPSNQKIFEQATQALHSGDYAAAESGFRKVLKTDPRNIGAAGKSGCRLLAHAHRYAKAIDRSTSEAWRSAR